MSVWGTIGELVQTQQEFGEFVAGPAPQNTFLSALHSRARENCQRYASGEAWYTQLSPIGRETTANFCRPYLASQGWDEPQFPGDVPFTGGQCPKAYTINYTVRNPRFGTETSGASGPHLGPIGGPFSGFRDGAYRVWFTSNDSGPGTIINFGYATGLEDQAPQTVSFGVTTSDGSPDDCGSAPLEPGPNAPPLLPPRPPSENPTDSPDEPIRIPLPPVKDPYGVPIDLPDFEVPDFRSPFPVVPGGESGSPPPGDRGIPGGGEETGEGGEAEGEAPPNSDLTGVLLELVSAAPFVNRTELASGTVYRGVAYVRLGGDPGVDLQPEGSTVIFPQFFEAPPLSTRWTVSAGMGYNLRVIPYYRSREAQQV